LFLKPKHSKSRGSALNELKVLFIKKKKKKEKQLPKQLNPQVSERKRRRKRWDLREDS